MGVMRGCYVSVLECPKGGGVRYMHWLGGVVHSGNPK